MREPALLLITFATLAACAPAPEQQRDVAVSDAASRTAATPATAPDPAPPPAPPAQPIPPNKVVPAAPVAAPAPARTAAARQPGDLPPCPGINPDIRRPPGSNCLGIVPAACGADKLAAIIGRRDSAALRQEVTALVGDRRQRWTRPGEAVTDDLDADRLNVALDAQGRVTKVDCY